MILTDPFVRVTYRSSPPCSTNTAIASTDRNVVASRHPVTATSIAAVAAIAASVAAETASRGSGVRVALQLWRHVLVRVAQHLDQLLRLTPPSLAHARHSGGRVREEAHSSALRVAVGERGWREA